VASAINVANSGLAKARYQSREGQAAATDAAAWSNVAGSTGKGGLSGCSAQLAPKQDKTPIAKDWRHGIMARER